MFRKVLTTSIIIKYKQIAINCYLLVQAVPISNKIATLAFIRMTSDTKHQMHFEMHQAILTRLVLKFPKIYTYLQFRILTI